MSLHYRGVAYDPATSDLKFAQTPESAGHYRGATWKIHPARAIQPKRSDLHLKYRGARVDAN
ncbi:MAG: DUF4278 domain-containing protein [Cyanobacteria bacterium P01_A01_bin.135]